MPNGIWPYEMLHYKTILKFKNKEVQPLSSSFYNLNQSEEVGFFTIQSGCTYILVYIHVCVSRFRTQVKGRGRW